MSIAGSLAKPAAAEARNAGGAYRYQFGVRFSGDGKALISAPVDIVEYASPDGGTHIGKNAFMGRVRLVKLYIPDSVTEIWCVAFVAGFSLASVDIPAGVVGGVEDFAFCRCSSLAKIVMPDRAMAIVE